MSRLGPVMETLDALDHLEGYRRLFFDPGFWTPYVRIVCARHGLEARAAVRTGVAGTCPAFIVEERWLVKFFGRLFNGGEAFAAERETSRLTALDPGIPTARVVAQGQLDPGGSWPWPYLIFEFIHGKSTGELADEIQAADWPRIAREMGQITRRLHALPLDESNVFPNRHEPYLAFLETQRAICVENQRKWGALPPHLIDQIDTFLPPLESLVDRTRPPHLIHADLTRDHLLGRVVRGRWESLALIDFGDARTGDFLYELVALHLDMLGGNKQYLTAFLDGYELPASARAELPRKALATSLLHQFNVFSALPAERFKVDRLEELAVRLWDTGA